MGSAESSRRPALSEDGERGGLAVEAAMMLEGIGQTVQPFEAFFAAEYPRLVKSMYLVTLDPAEAEDLAQEAMARVFSTWDRVAVMEYPMAYVYRVAVNEHRKRDRRNRLRRAVSIVPQASSEPHVTSEIRDALERLPVPSRQAVVLVDWLGLTSEEAASVLRVRPSTVRSRLQRSRSTLRNQLSRGNDQLSRGNDE